MCTRWSPWAIPNMTPTPLFSGNPVVPVMAPEPPADVLPIGPGHPAAEINHLARGCDVRPLVADTLLDGEAPAFQVWARPREAKWTNCSP